MAGTNDHSENHPEPVEVVARDEAGSVAVTPVIKVPAVNHGTGESFPGADPVAVSITKVLTGSDDVPQADASTDQKHDAPLNQTSDQPAGQGGRTPSEPMPPLNPGDDAAPGTPGTGETFCPVCGGSRVKDGAECKNCGGTGEVTVGIGGA